MDNPDDTNESGITFEGFVKPTQNWFKMPNNWTDITAGITSLSEIKVVEYVIRHTWGYQEYDEAKTISTDEFVNGRRHADRTRMDKGTGLGETAVKDGLKRAIAHKYLLCNVDTSDKGRTKKSYSLNMNRIEGGRNVTGVTFRPGSHSDRGHIPTGVANRTPEGRNVTSRGSECDDRSEKETLERNLRKEEGVVEPILQYPEQTSSSAFSLDEITNDEKKLAALAGLPPTESLINTFRDILSIDSEYPLKTKIVETKLYLNGRGRKTDPITKQPLPITDESFCHNMMKSLNYVSKAPKEQTTPKTTAEKMATPVTDIAEAINKRNNLPPVPTAQQQRERIERMEQQQKARKQA